MELGWCAAVQECGCVGVSYGRGGWWWLEWNLTELEQLESLESHWVVCWLWLRTGAALEHVVEAVGCCESLERPVEVWVNWAPLKAVLSQGRVKLRMRMLTERVRVCGRRVRFAESRYSQGNQPNKARRASSQTVAQVILPYRYSVHSVACMVVVTPHW